MSCTRYQMGGHDYPENPTPCKCPVCGGFLKWELSNPICNKCKTELMIFPEIDEETGEELEYGKICPISSRDTHEKRSQE